MLLIADSGSTKCDWITQNSQGESLRFSTIGFNPLFHNSDWIVDKITQNTDLMHIAKSVTRLAYYGASVSSLERKKIILDALAAIFPHAHITADHDLTGSVYATCGIEPGIACILGTGSNSCYFDGKSIQEKAPALGYILGDEAGGAWFGKELLKMHLYHELPENISAALLKVGANKESIFTKVYQEPGANRYLASFTKIISQFRNDDQMQHLLTRGFDEFIEKHVAIYPESATVPIHFVGSIALHFKEELVACCEKNRLQVGVITNEPVVSLYQFHLNHENL